MKRVLGLLFLGSAVAIASRAVLGCATSDDEPEATADAAGEDASRDALVPPDGSVATDAPPDVNAAPPTCSADHWCYEDLPDGGSYDASVLPVHFAGSPTFPLRGVWVGPDGQPWAVSAVGHVLHADATGWHVVTVIQGSLHAVWGWGTTDVWIAGEQGLVMHGTIAGGTVTFQKITIATTQTISRIVGRSATDVWAIVDGVNGFGTQNRVFRLDAAGTTLTPTTVPGTFSDSTAKLRLSALWTSGNDVWVGGYETTCGGPGKCNFADGLVSMKWIGADDGGTDAAASWDQVRLQRDYSNLITSAGATNDGVQLVTIGIGDDAYVVRVASDVTKLDGGPPDASPGIVDAGTHAWTEELAESFGAPEGVWATNRNDIWLVGHSGVVRHFDGTGWQLVHLSLTNVTPLLSDLYGIHAVVAPSGQQDIWVVGDDVAIHRMVKQ